MADDLSLLLRVRGDASGAKQAAAETRAAISQLRVQIAQLRASEDAGAKASIAQIQGRIAQLRAQSAAAQAASKSNQSLATSFQSAQTALQSMGGPLGTVSSQIGTATSMLSGFSSSAAGAAGPIAIAVAGIVALHAAVAILGKQLIDLAVHTADWQGKLFDMSQQVGVSVETLSGLEVVAATTGGSLDSMAQSLIIFQRNMVEANDPTSKAAKLFKDLGVSSTEADQAIRQAVQGLHEMGETIEQTNAAAEAFGSRGAKAWLAIAKETDGSLDKLIEKLRAMGVLLSGDAAKAADEFNDQLIILQYQFRAVGAVVGREFLPPLLNGLKSLSKLIEDNQAAIQVLGSAVRVFVTGPLDVWVRTNATLINQLSKILNYLIPITELANRKWTLTYEVVFIGGVPVPLPGGLLGTQKPSFGQPEGGGLGKPERRGSGGGGGGGRKRDTSLQDAIADAKLAEREILQQLRADVEENKRALDEQARDIEEFTRRAIELSDKQLNATIDRINAEIAANEAALRKKQITQAEFARRDRELTLETNEAVAKNDDELWELEQKRSRQIAAAEFAAHERSVRMADEASERLIAIIRDRVDRQIISELEGERQIMPIIEQGYERRKKLLEDELTRITTSLERKAAINDELIQLDGERADAAEQAARRIRDAQDSEQLQRPRRVRDATRPRSVEEEEFGRPLEDQLSVWESGLEAMEDRMEDFHDAANTYVVGAFNNMADAATSAIEAWILYGGSLGKALKQALAAELAHVAASAAVQAALHAAYALGSLAFGNYAAAAKHGMAALKFLAVAALTGIAARSLAGNSFQQAAVNSGAVSRGEGGGSSGARSNQPPGVTDVNRRAQPTVQVIVQLHGDIATSALNTRVVNAVVESLDLNDERLTGKIQGAAKRIG